MAQPGYLHNYIIKRYLQNSENNWEDIVKRVSKLYPPIEPFMKTIKFIPGGRNLATLNTNHVVIPNCVVVDIEDDLTNIFTTLSRLMELTRRGAGIGMNFGKLRPAGTSAKHFGAKSCGPVGFLNMYSVVMKTIQQMSRHGAFIGILPITHPDVLNFIEVKQDLTKINNFNLSILVDNEFINNVRDHPDEIAKANYTIKHSDGTEKVITNYNYITYDNNFVVQDVSPVALTYKEMFDVMVKCMWRTGEPGLLFKENINKDNILRPILGDITACNPCAEISMYPNECCNLGSINLANFVKPIDYNPLPKAHCKDEDDPEFDINYFVNEHMNIPSLRKCVFNAVVFLDKVIDEINTDDKLINEFVRKTRRIGLGIMGLHDMLIAMRIPYDRPEARQIVKIVLGIIKDEAYKTSAKLVNGFDVAYNGDTYTITPKGNILNKFGVITKDVKPRANLTLMTIAPNGSTSMIANVSSGVEPYFSLGYYRLVDNSTKQTGLIINEQLKKWLQYHIQDSIRDKITHEIITKGINSVDSNIIPDYVKNVFKTAQDISPRDHILMLAAAQSVVDNAISKTINLPENATKEDITDCILLAHKLGVKGMTVYRDNCRQNVITSSVNHTSSSECALDKGENKTTITQSLSMDSCKDGQCDI